MRSIVGRPTVLLNRDTEIQCPNRQPEGYTKLFRVWQNVAPKRPVTDGDILFLGNVAATEVFARDDVTGGAET